MTRIPRFTIVTPSYNQRQFIGETIRSVLTQEGDFEIEYFVMDGGSTDGAVDVIREYAEQVASPEWKTRSRGVSMQWVSERDGGQTDAINKGLRRATGDFVSYLNSDDLYAPGALQQVAQSFAADPHADFVYGDGDVIDEHGELQWEWLSRPYDHAVMTSYHFLWNDFTNYIMQQATFWRRRVHDRMGYFDDSFHFAMDVEYWIRAGHTGLRLVHLPRKLGKFRLIQGTKSLSSPTVFWEDYMEIFRRYRDVNALGRFFAHYYYGLAIQRDFDLDRTLEDGKVVFARWIDLPKGDRKALERQARLGFGLTCVLAARALLAAGRTNEATSAFRRALRTRPGLVAHPSAIHYLVNRGTGPSIRRQLDRLRERAIATYRRRWYDYRYHQPRAS